MKNKFIVGIGIYKVFQGIVELAGGLILLKYSYEHILRVVYRLARPELIEDPQDRFVALIFKYIPLLAEYKKQAVIILLAVGVYDLVSGIGLFYGKNWAKIIILAALIITLPYNGYKLATDFDVLSVISFLLQVAFIVILYRFKPSKDANDGGARRASPKKG